MSFVHGKSAQLLLGDAAQGFDVSGWLNKATPSTTVDTAESTTFGNDSKTYVVGLTDAKFSLEGFFEFVDGTPDTGIDVIIRSVLGQDQFSANGDVIVVVNPTGGAALGERAQMVAGVTTNYEVDTPIDGIVSIKAEVQGDKPVAGGIVMQPLAALSGGAPANTASHDDGVGVSALTRALVLCVVCTAHDLAGSPTFKLQTSPDDSIWTDVAGSTITVDDVCAQRVRVEGVADRYVRVQRTDNAAAHTSFAAYAREYL